MHPKFLLFAVLAAVGLALIPTPPARAGFTDQQRPRHPRMEVVFVLDTTGSMSGMIAGAKQKIWAIANKLKSAQPTPEIRFGLVGYRDRGDAYVTKVYGLTSDLDEVYSNLYGFQADGGDDEPESVNEALHKAVRDMQWSGDSEVLKVIFLVGDAPPHMDYANDVRYPQVCRLANKKDIRINTLQCGRLDGTEEIWREIANRTNGTYAAILQNGGTRKIETQYDRDIIRLNLQLDATIVRYGSVEEQQKAAANKSLLGSMSAEAVADRSSYLGKGEAGAVMAGKGDLLVEVMNGRERIDTVNEKLLEPKVRAMAPAARKQYVEQKLSERRAIQDELSELVAKRDATVAEKLKTESKDGVLELNAFQVLEDQAKEKGFEFKK